MEVQYFLNANKSHIIDYNEPLLISNKTNIAQNKSHKTLI